MTLETKELVRTFRYNSVDLPDPGAQYTVEQVRDFYSATYPEITSAAVEGPEEKDGKLVYTFRRAVGTKGSRFPNEMERHAQEGTLALQIERLRVDELFELHLMETFDALPESFTKDDMRHAFHRGYGARKA